ncbi:beta-lactamase family protein [Streptomyces sp. NBC_00006]|uniref:serine hydrolase domain-containing protein n=1 Tax=Streptomyces sp. NBC_00006 TaxID=2975619 RepID=UPI00224E7231|nr:serine hydrolase domain-containing protein [Streptomyces sp. NBC_00006]MCX5531807.1 beta-lactamase family protein [Streptomyces sp. NBC_00006]
MPALRTLLAIPLAVAVLCLGQGSAPGPTTPADDTLPLLVTRGKAPSAALLATAGSTGHFTTTSPTLTRSDHVRAGSITKTFIATVVLQLAAEHRLKLSARVTTYLPSLTGTRTLTVRSLLTQTSGLYDFTTTTRGHVPLTPTAVAKLSLSEPRTTQRGTWAYSNTNYVLLGMIIHQVTGHSYATEARSRIIDPLHLTGTMFPGTRTTVPSPHGPDAVRLDPRTAGASGELISTLPDLNHFYAALLEGRLLPPGALRTMLNTRPTDGHYGMGLYPEKLPCGTTVWGHNGRIAHTYIRAAATRTGSHVVTYRTTKATLSGSGAPERRILTAEFCHSSPAKSSPAGD